MDEENWFQVHSVLNYVCILSKRVCHDALLGRHHEEMPLPLFQERSVRVAAL